MQTYRSPGFLIVCADSERTAAGQLGAVMPFSVAMNAVADR
jgi:homoaconitase/3-isopropylmalate dehydratase large subunit